MNSFLGKVSIVFSKKETFGQRLKKTLPGNYRNGEVTGAYSETAREKASWYSAVWLRTVKETEAHRKSWVQLEFQEPSLCSVVLVCLPHSELTVRNVMSGMCMLGGSLLGKRPSACPSLMRTALSAPCGLAGRGGRQLRAEEKKDNHNESVLTWIGKRWWPPLSSMVVYILNPSHNQFML